MWWKVHQSDQYTIIQVSTSEKTWGSGQETIPQQQAVAGGGANTTLNAMFGLVCQVYCGQVGRQAYLSLDECIISTCI